MISPSKYGLFKRSLRVGPLLFQQGAVASDPRFSTNERRKQEANMAAYMRSVRCVIGLERQFCAARGTSIAVESRRYVRGLRRKPVRVIIPDSEPDKVTKGTSRSNPGGQSVKSKTDVKPAAQASRAPENDFVGTKSTAKNVHVSVTKDQVDGLRYERASAGDKRLG